MPDSRLRVHEVFLSGVRGPFWGYVSKRAQEVISEAKHAVFDDGVAKDEEEIMQMIKRHNHYQEFWDEIMQYINASSVEKKQR